MVQSKWRGRQLQKIVVGTKNERGFGTFAWIQKKLDAPLLNPSIRNHKASSRTRAQEDLGVEIPEDFAGITYGITYALSAITLRTL